MVLKYDPLNPPAAPLQLETDQRHVIEFYVRDLLRVEADDLHFHAGSPVFLGEASDLATPGAGTAISGLDVLKKVYEHAETNKDHKLLLTGHADSSDTGADLLELSRQRAQGIHALLTGDRNTWVGLAVKHGKTEDYQQLLIWFNALMGWPCRPNEKSGKHDENTSLALRSFQACYRDDFGQEIAVDGDMGPETWEAMFDVVARELAAALQTDEQGLAEQQKGLSFLDPAWIACADQLPCEALDGAYRGGNRRVEVLFCAPDEVPPQSALGDGDKCKLQPPAIRYEALEVQAALKRIWLTLHAVDELGYRLPNLSLDLVHKGQTVETITTDDKGIWQGHIASKLPVEVHTSDGGPVFFGGQSAKDTRRAAQLVPGIGRQVLIDLVVPGKVKPEVLEQRRTLNSLYDARAGRGAFTQRSGGADEDLGEPISEISGRGKAGVERTNRTKRAYVLDNLGIRAGFDAADRIEELATIIEDWLTDCAPSAVNYGYLLAIFDSDRVHFYDGTSHIDTLMLAEDSVLEGPTGLYGALMDHDGWLPYESLSDGGRIGLHFTKMKGELTRQHGHVLARQELLAYMDKSIGADTAAKNILAEHAHKYQLAYKLDSVDLTIALAAAGGTGQLEAYPEEPGLRARVDDRNSGVVGQCVVGFSRYTTYYISRIKQILANREASPEQLEKELFELGPPLACPTFPVPPGATEGEYQALVYAAQAGLDKHNAQDEYDAWQALTKALNQIWGVRSLGSSWIKCEFVLDAQVAAPDGGPLKLGPTQVESKVGLGAKISWNFEADTDGGLKQSSSHSESIFLGPAVVGFDGDKTSVTLSGKVAPEFRAGRPEGGATAPPDPIHPLEQKQADAANKDMWRREQDEARRALDPNRQRRARDWNNFDVGPFTASWQPGIDAKTGCSYGVLSLATGPLSFSFTQPSGAMTAKFSDGRFGDVSVSFDPTTGRLGYGLTLDLRKGLKHTFAKKRKQYYDEKRGEYFGDPEKWKPEATWIDHVPNIQVACTGSTQLLPERGGAVLAMVLRSPGFFRMRPRAEFVTLQWNSLTGDERAALSILDYGQQLWDTRALTAATRGDYFRLTAAQQVAVFALPIPNCDPYWVAFWHDTFAKQAKPASDDASQRGGSKG